MKQALVLLFFLSTSHCCNYTNTWIILENINSSATFPIQDYQNDTFCVSTKNMKNGKAFYTSTRLTDPTETSSFEQLSVKSFAKNKSTCSTSNDSVQGCLSHCLDKNLENSIIQATISSSNPAEIVQQISKSIDSAKNTVIVTAHIDTSDSSQLTMIFLINNTYEMWVAIPILNKALFTSWKYPYVMAVDISVFIATIILIIRASFIISKYKMFHINLRVLLVFQLYQWLEILLARYFMFPYLIGYRFLGDTTKIYHHFWTDNTGEMVPISSVLEEWPLFLGGFLYTHHFASCIFFLFSVSAERAIASFYLSDYEKMTRPYISISIILISMMFASIYSLVFIFNFFTFLVTSILITLVTGTSVVLYVFVYYYNTKIKLMTDNNKQKDKYTLARRFQTMENLKSLTMAKYVVTTHAIYVFLCEACYLCVFYGVESKYWEIFIYILDTVVTYSNLFIVTTVLFSVPTWKRAFLRPCIAFRRMQSNMVSMTEEGTERDPEEDAKKISTVYFEQLGRAWT